ncbi:NUDIX hydrolase [Ligilactobacillus salivarius]|uniref:NUDIX hydrolase n=1 Tax=Ligilactobacillus salivarius TaxID=1624 RepID=UPI0022E31AA4|nr:NUDIX hydrolase [Ligilactobacillus salivarius]
MNDLMTQLKSYVPFNEQEEKDKQLIIDQLANAENIFTRKNKLAHFTASAWIINPDKDKVLMAYHNIYQSWSWLGGHADGNSNLKQVVLKEIQEESGLSDVKFLSDDIFSLEVLTVDGHEKRGEYVSSHLHLNVTYLFEADPNIPLRIKPDENSQIAWLDLSSLDSKVSEDWFNQRIYHKLIEKVNLLS